MLKKNPLPILLILTLALVGLGGCQQVFETASDVQARHALLDLIQIQEDYHNKNQRYARNLVEIREAGFQLDFHAGIVYLEIEQASAGGWRAVALPAESTTARVFAFDSQRGGFYEMDTEEVSSYVLGALHFIRKKQNDQRILGGAALGTILILSVFGLRTGFRNRVPGSLWLSGPFYLSLPPLIFSALALVYMEQEIVLSNLIQGLLIGNCVLTALCIWITWTGFKKVQPGQALTSLSALAVCTVTIGLFNILVTTHTFMNYSENPDPLEKYIKPEGLSPRVGFGAQ